MVWDTSDVSQVQLIGAMVAAGAAILAAALSAITLWTTGRREERKWRREALLDTAVQFLDGSFDLPGNQAFNQLAAGESLAELEASTVGALQKSATALTRLRVLAPSAVVAAAEELHEFDYQVKAALLSSRSRLNTKEWLTLADRRMEARTGFLNAARKALRLRPARPLKPGSHRARIELDE